MNDSPFPVVNPGRMRHAITFYSRTETKSPATGSGKGTYTEIFAQVYGEMNPKGGSKFFDAARFNVQSFETLSVWRMGLDGLDETMQAEYANRRFEILNIQNVGEVDTQLMLALRELK